MCASVKKLLSAPTLFACWLRRQCRGVTMDNAEALFAKLMAIRKNADTLAQSKGFLDWTRVEHYFSKYAVIRDALIEGMPELYADLPTHELPAFAKELLSQGQFISPRALKELNEDIDYVLEVRAHANREALAKGKPMTLDLFISHSNKDADVAKALIELLQAACSIPANRIRCTSVDGYKLDIGTSVEAQLRQEVHDAFTFIGLITPSSVQSAYVAFELGARWGADLHIAPLLAKGADASYLRGPLSGINALNCSSANEVYQLVSNISKRLNVQPSQFAVYSEHVTRLVTLSNVAPDAVEGSTAKPPTRTKANYTEVDVINELSAYIGKNIVENKYKPIFVNFQHLDNEIGFESGASEKHIEKAANMANCDATNKGGQTCTINYRVALPAVGGIKSPFESPLRANDW
jgi:hypothetical protein